MMGEPDDAEYFYYDDDLPEDEDENMDDCGMMPDGQCLLAGSEWCDWDCPHSRALDRAARIKAMKAKQDPTP